MARRTHLPAPTGDDWLAVSDQPLPLSELASWPVLPGCGATVMFVGTVRDHSFGRPGVASLEYEAYTGAALRAMSAIAADLRQRWPALGRVALLHRTGHLAPTEVAVVVAVSAPHRQEAFDAARYAIEAVKTKVPIWKLESWDGGSDWGLGAQALVAQGPQATVSAGVLGR